MKTGREKIIINILVTVCISAGFACFALVILPEQLKKAKAFPNNTSNDIGKINISNIISLEPQKNPDAILSAAKVPDVKSGFSTDAQGEKTWLKIPEGCEADVAFWRDIYTKYGHDQALLHHPRHLKIVYEVVDLSDISTNSSLSNSERTRYREERINERRKEIVDILQRLSTNPNESALNERELKIKRLFSGIDEQNMFARAALEDGVRAQTGQRDKFIPGLKYSGRYMGEIEKIFDSYDLPRELTRLIFVESMFNPQAVSSVGASGIWQFMRSTGKLYLRIDDEIDERNDPISATHAAAKLLKSNYEKLGEWPLAINAYNTGLGRITQAVSSLGTNDIGKIIKNFDHPAYGFASRNFFLEYLAALHVAENSEKYFGPIEFDKPAAR